MFNLTNSQILDLVNETIAWGANISEMWAGTLNEKIIDRRRSEIMKAVDENDLESAYQMTCDLAQTLDHSEREYND